jgi:hypothetical protein
MPERPRIIGNESTPVLCCWFVEFDGSGKCGYAAVDGSRGYLPPEGGGLFSSIRELRNVLERQKMHNIKILPVYGGEVPKGWKIRGLTTNEMRFFRNVVVY